jgi:hypothetical protein
MFHLIEFLLRVRRAKRLSGRDQQASRRFTVYRTSEAFGVITTSFRRSCSRPASSPRGRIAMFHLIEFLLRVRRAMREHVPTASASNLAGPGRGKRRTAGGPGQPVGFAGKGRVGSRSSPRASPSVWEPYLAAPAIAGISVVRSQPRCSGVGARGPPHWEEDLDQTPKYDPALLQERRIDPILSW